MLLQVLIGYSDLIAVMTLQNGVGITLQNGVG